MNTPSSSAAAIAQHLIWSFVGYWRLDDSSDRAEIPLTAHVRALMERVGAVGHATFGGRLSPDAHGFPASARAKTRAGDWRHPARIRAWAVDIARAAMMAALLRLSGVGIALALYAVAVPLGFGG